MRSSSRDPAIVSSRAKSWTFPGKMTPVFSPAKWSSPAAVRYRVQYRNENIISWRDDQVSVSPPDLIAVADSHTGAAIANPEFKRGQFVTVLGFPAPAIWRTPAGLEVFGPAHFGFDIPYVPIERRLR
jgi:DUF917 family protein